MFSLLWGKQSLPNLTFPPLLGTWRTALHGRYKQTSIAKQTTCYAAVSQLFCPSYQVNMYLKKWDHTHVRAPASAKYSLDWTRVTSCLISYLLQSSSFSSKLVHFQLLQIALLVWDITCRLWQVFCEKGPHHKSMEETLTHDKKYLSFT